MEAGSQRHYIHLRFGFGCHRKERLIVYEVYILNVVLDITAETWL